MSEVVPLNMLVELTHRVRTGYVEGVIQITEGGKIKGKKAEVS